MKTIANLTIFIILSLTLSAYTQWSTNTSGNTPVSVGSGDQRSVVSVNSDEGGLILAWQDGRNGGSSNSDIYAQKVDRFGQMEWSLNGVAICNALNSQHTPALISDNSGGAIIVWDDSRVINNLDIYAQRIDAAGDVKWTVDGVEICTATGVQRNATIIPDGQGGAIITWQDYRAGGSEIDIYAQRIDSMGVAQWSADGLPICTATGRQILPQIVPDGAGGAIIVWQDERGTESDIYAQRIDENGSPQWALNGISVCSALSYQEFHRIKSTDLNEVLITWSDFRNDVTLNSSDIYAQKLSVDGVGLWGTDGVSVCSNPEDQNSPEIVSDGNGGAIISWDDYRSSNLDVYAQRIDSQGNALWTQDGVEITNQTSAQDESVIVEDGQGGAIIAWEDLRDSNFDIYSQRIDAAGNIMWQANGVAISTANSSQRYMHIISDENSGAIISWEDRRTGNDGDDVYAQQVNGSGQIGVVTSIENQLYLPEAYYLEQNYPNPFNPSTTISFSIPDASFVSLKIFNSLGEEIETLVAKELGAGNYQYEWNAKKFTSGIYFYSLQTGNYVNTKKMILLK